MTRLGRDLIASLREAIAGDFARVTVSGVTWVRVEEVAAEREACAKVAEEHTWPHSGVAVAAAIRARGHSKIESFEEEFKEAWKRGKKMP